MNKFLKRTGIQTLVLFLAMGQIVSAQTTANVSDVLSAGKDAFGLTSPSKVTSIDSEKLTGLNPYSITIPQAWGNIEEVFQGLPDKPLVVHIQDAHSNYEAQVSIKNILGHLHKEYGMNVVHVEGASTKLDPSVFKNSYIKEANVKVADYMMREGMLSGAEAFAVEAETPVELYGIEDRLLYMENVRTFRSVYSHRQDLDAFFDEMRLLTKDLRNKYLNTELLDLTRKMEAYSHEQIELLDYLLFLNDLSEKHEIVSLRDLKQLSQFPNLVRIVRLHDLEEKIDQTSLLREAQDLRKKFNMKDSDFAEQQFLNLLEHPQKAMKPRSYYEKLNEMLDAKKITLLAYPQLRQFAEFLILQDEIEHHGFFKEVSEFEKFIQAKLLKTKTERHLMDLLKAIDLLDQFYRLEVNRERLSFIMERFDKIRASLIEKRLDYLAQQAGILPSRFEGDVTKLDELMNEVEYFYRIVLDRDRSFVTKVLEHVDIQSTGKTALVTGGFHTDGITRIFREQNVNYVVVTPKVDVNQGSETYLKVMLNEESALGTVFAGTFAVAPPAHGQPIADLMSTTFDGNSFLKALMTQLFGFPLGLAATSLLNRDNNDINLEKFMERRSLLNAIFPQEIVSLGSTRVSDGFVTVDVTLFEVIPGKLVVEFNPQTSDFTARFVLSEEDNERANRLFGKLFQGLTADLTEFTGTYSVDSPNLASVPESAIVPARSEGNIGDNVATEVSLSLAASLGAATLVASSPTPALATVLSQTPGDTAYLSLALGILVSLGFDPNDQYVLESVLPQISNLLSAQSEALTIDSLLETADRDPNVGTPEAIQALKSLRDLSVNVPAEPVIYRALFDPKHFASAEELGFQIASLFSAISGLEPNDNGFVSIYVPERSALLDDFISRYAESLNVVVVTPTRGESISDRFTADLVDKNTYVTQARLSGVQNVAGFNASAFSAEVPQVRVAVLVPDALRDTLSGIELPRAVNLLQGIQRDLATGQEQAAHLLESLALPVISALRLTNAEAIRQKLQELGVVAGQNGFSSFGDVGAILQGLQSMIQAQIAAEISA